VTPRHPAYQSTVNQGFFWWEIDISYYVLKLLSWVGLVRDLRVPPKHVLEANRIRDGHADIGMFKANWAKAVASLENAMAHAGASLENAKAHAGASLENARVHYEERRRALDQLVKDTTQAAHQIAKMAPKPVVD
jgi:stearoyl-CoA desaturase (Delta-9 desaturase)